MKLSSKFLTAGIVVLLTAGPAFPQKKEILQLNADVLQLQNQVKQLQISVDQKNATITSLVEKMADQVNGIQSSLQKMTDVIESVKSSNDKTAGELRVLVNNLGVSVDHVNEGLSSVRTQVNALTQQLTTQASSEPLAKPEDILRTSTIDQLAGNYDLAVDGFREFLSKYPNHPRAAEAQFAIGDAYFNQKKFEQAVVEYDLFLQKYSNDDRTRSALYKKGLAHVELNQAPLATAAFNRVIKDFPNTTESANAQQRIKELSTRRAR